MLTCMDMCGQTIPKKFTSGPPASAPSSSLNLTAISLQQSKNLDCAALNAVGRSFALRMMISCASSLETHLT